MPTTFPYNYFKTEKIFTLKTLETSPAISVITSRDPKSIFSIYRDLIIKNIAENKLDDTTVDNNNEKIEKLYNDFKDINVGLSKNFFSNIYNFCKSMYDTKYLFLKEKKNYSKFSSLLRQLNINKNLFTKNLRYENPITFNLNSNISLNRILNDYDNEEKNAIDNIILGNNINFSLPSIGPILSIYTPDPYKIDISTLIYTLITTDNVPFPPNYLEYVPLFKQNITDTLSNILLQSDKENNLWNVKIGNSTNNNTLKYIKRYFKSVSISLSDIFFDTTGIKKKYFVPYKKIENNIISETSSIPSPAASSESSAPPSNNDKIKTVIDANNTIVNYVIQEMVSNPNNLNKQNMKNILCSYLFFVINVFYDFYKKYIDKLNDVIVSLSVSKYKNQLNIAYAFKYIEKLNISLLNFKKILLNNFYELFLPSSIINNNYGMILNKDGFYVSASSFIASNDDIRNNFPFKESISHLNIVNNKISLINFMFLNKSNTDIYDDKLLELGGFSYNNIITRNAISILNDFFDIDKRKNNLNIFLLELLERFFKENSCTELITNLEAIINEPTNVKKEKDIDEYYKKCLFSSATYFIEVMKIDKKNSSKITNEEYKKRSIYLLASIILSYNVEICKYLLRDSTFLSTNTRRKVTDKFKTYSSKVFDKITDMKQKYKENKIIKSNINKPVNAFTTVPFWESLKSKIQNKKLLIPVLNKSNIIFIDIIDYALRGKYGNDLILNFSNKNITENSNYIILFGKSLTEIKNNKLRIIKSEFMDKIKLINDSQIIRKNLFTLLNNSLIYNQYSSEITSSFKLFDLFKTFIKNKPSNFNKLIVSHIQIKNIVDSV